MTGPRSQPLAMFEPIADRDATFRVFEAFTGALLGFCRLDGTTGDYIARSVGNASEAADIKRVTSRTEAARFLASCVNGVSQRGRRIG